MKEQFDTSTPIGRMMVYIIIALGQFEREQTSERVSVNCHSRALRGLMNGGPAPLGYDKNPDKKGLLVVNEREAEIARTIFQTFLECGSRAKTILKLREMGITPKRTSKRAQSRGPADWTVQTLGSLLKHAAYIGHREVNKLYKDEDPEHLKPWQKYQMVKASWTPILSSEVFFEAQKILEEASASERTRINSGEKRSFLLTGILTCGETGLPLVGQAGHGSSGTVHRYYHYVRRPKNLKNIRPRLHADELEEKLIGEFKTALVTAGYFNELEKVLKGQSDVKNKRSESEHSRAHKELSDVTKRIGTLWANQGRMQLGEEALRLASEELNRLAKQKDDLEKYVASVDRNAGRPAALKDQVLFVENQIRALLQGWPKATPAMRKRLLRRTVKEIVVTSEEMQFTFWLSAHERDESLFGGDEGDPDEAKKILAFRRFSPRSQDQNSSIQSSGKVRNGSGEGN